MSLWHAPRLVTKEDVISAIKETLNLVNGYTSISSGASKTISVTGEEAMIVIEHFVYGGDSTRTTGATALSKTVYNPTGIVAYIGYSALIKR